MRHATDSPNCARRSRSRSDCLPSDACSEKVVYGPPQTSSLRFEADPIQGKLDVDNGRCGGRTQRLGRSRRVGSSSFPPFCFFFCSFRSFCFLFATFSHDPVMQSGWSKSDSKPISSNTKMQVISYIFPFCHAIKSRTETAHSVPPRYLRRLNHEGKTQ